MRKELTLGNVTVYSTKNTENDYTIQVYNGSNCVFFRGLFW